MISHLQHLKRASLDKVNDRINTSMWEQKWLSVESLLMLDEWKETWNLYFLELKKWFVKLIDQNDKPVWNFNDVGGHYTIKHVYISTLNWDSGTPIGWWKYYWKVNPPLKSKLHIWLVLQNKDLTWDVFQKRSFEGSSMCPLCKCNCETNEHILYSCPYTNEVWALVCAHFNLNSL